MKLIACGTGASSGQYTGRPRVINSVDELDLLQDGEILVIKASDPAWTVGMLKAGAFISELGGIISHAAIVAREMGIPCVVAVPDATTLLSNYNIVTVDGRTGTISLPD